MERDRDKQGRSQGLNTGNYKWYPLLTESRLQAIAADDSSLLGFLTESWVMIGFLEEVFHFPSQKDSIFQLFMSHAEEDNT